MRTRSLTLVAAMVAAVISAAPAGAQTFAVIVNESNPVAAVSLDQLSAIFLKKAKWAGRMTTAPVDLRKQSPLRAEFTQTVHNRSMPAVASYWQQQIFSGERVPPPEKATEAEVIEFVRRTPGAIGYVSFTADLGTGVKVVTLVEESPTRRAMAAAH